MASHKGVVLTLGRGHAKRSSYPLCEAGSWTDNQGIKLGSAIYIQPLINHQSFSYSFPTCHH